MYLCSHCRGKKKVLSTGCIYKDCKHCQGIGYTKEKTTIISQTIEAEITQPEKQKGRPRKKVIEPEQSTSFSTDDNVVAIQSGTIGSMG